MKPTSKKDYPFVVECENQKQTNLVIHYYHPKNEEYLHWLYVAILDDTNNYGFDTKEYFNTNLKIIPYSEWIQLPDYAPEEVAFTSKNKDVEFNLSQNTISMKEIIGYKLVKPEYEESAGRIAYGKLSSDNYKFIKHKDDLAFLFKSPAAERLEKAGVLDLWFEPVYEEATKNEKLKEYLTFREFKFEEKDIENIINIVNENNENSKVRG